MKTKNKLDAKNVLERLDMFGQLLPTFNIGGRQTVNTLVGGFMTVVIYTIVLAYGTIKFIELSTRANPNIAQFFKQDAFDFTDVLNLNEENFKIAFAVEGFRSKDLKIDPKYVKWIFRTYGKREGKEFEKILPYHRCTDQDYAEFDDIQVNSKKVLEQMREDEDRGFLCLDWDDAEPFTIYGHYRDADYQRLEATLAPCNYIHDYISDVGDTIHPECEYDPVKQFEYLSSIRIVVLHNSGRLDLESFGEDSIIRESKMISTQVDPYTPSYISIYCRLNEL